MTVDRRDFMAMSAVAAVSAALPSAAVGAGAGFNQPLIDRLHEVDDCLARMRLAEPDSETFHAALERLWSLGFQMSALMRDQVKSAHSSLR